MNIKLVALLCIATLFCGCCSTHSKMSDTGSGIFTWKTDRSAAVTYPASGKIGHARACMQMALSMTDSSSKIEAAISDSILKIIEKIPAEPTARDLIKITSEIQKTSKALNKATERTTFLMIGSFYLCQLHANGLSEDFIKELGKELIKAAADLEYNEYNIGSLKKTNNKIAEE